MKKKVNYDAVMADPFAYLNTLKGDQMLETLNLDTLGKSQHSLVTASDLASEIDIAKAIRDVVDSNMRVPKDMRIDDGDLPLAGNFFEWVTQDRFGLVNNEKPFIEQLCWAIIAFNEACHYCSDNEYLFHDHGVDDTYARFERKVSLLHNGVCPNCKKGRADWLNNGEGKFIQELNISAGQRSGKSIAVGGWYTPYLTHRMLKLQNPSAFYNLKTGTMLHCTFVALTYVQAKDTLWQYFYATMAESKWFCIAEGGLISMADGTDKPIEDIVPGDHVTTLEGSNEVTRISGAEVKECMEVTLENGVTLTGTADHKVRCLSPCGESLVWKNIEDLTDQDYVVELE